MNFQRLLAELDDCPDDVADELAAGIVNDVSDWAAKNGFPTLIREWTPAASRVEVRRYLATAIEATRPIESLDAGPYSVVQAAKLLGVSKETVYKLCTEGDLAHVRIGNRITITDQQLSDYQAEAER